MTNFTELGLLPKLVEATETLGFSEPTPIQTQAIPLILQGRDIMGLAQTGTGKTAAFGLPLLHHLLDNPERVKPKHVRSLILAPTRELVNQIADNLIAYAGKTHLSVRKVVGGASINVQMKKLQRGCDVLVATPGRLLDLSERRAIHLSDARFLVLDEADQMLDLGFIHSLRKIAKLLGEPRQTLMFSATMPKQIAELSQTYLTNPERIEVARAGQAADKVRQSVHFLTQDDKLDKLHDLLIEAREGGSEDSLSLIFARTKHGAEKLMRKLVAAGFKAASIHGNKSQPQREKAIKAFRAGEINILVATDVAARGIDIPGVAKVYNYDLPEVAENYVHRIGRTARAGASGEAIAFCAPGDLELLRAIEKLMKIDLPIASGTVPDAQKARAEAQERRQRHGRGGRGGNRNGGGRKAGGHRGATGRNSGGRNGGGGHAEGRNHKPSTNRSSNKNRNKRQRARA